MLNFVIRWMVITIAVFVAANLRFLGITYDSGTALLTAALVLGVLNTFVKPLLMLFTLPLLLLSFGILILVINAFLFYLASWLVTGFHVASFWSALGGSIVVSLISLLLGGGRRTAAAQRTVVVERGPPPGKGPIIDV